MAKGFGNIMKQAQQMQAKLLKVQEELEELRVEGSAGGGMVKVIANGKQDVLEIKIDPEVVDPDDVEMLEDLILAALHEARANSQEIMNEKMKSVTGGISIPGLM